MNTNLENQISLNSAGFKQVGVLTLASILAFSGMSLIVLIGSLIGLKLAPSSELSTLPIAAFVIGTALGVAPAIQLMKIMGRRNGFLLYALVGIISSLLMAFALSLESFILFCLGNVLLGSVIAAFQQARFAAMELVDLEKGPVAVSIIMSGGIVAAMVGPEVGVFGRTIMPIEYQGSLLLMAVAFLFSALVLLFYKPVKVIIPEQKLPSQSLKLLSSNSSFILAVMSSAIGFMIMSFLMTATPLSMHHHFGHSLDDTKWIIQSHIVAMFLPSVIVPLLIKKWGIHNVMLLGLICYSVTVISGLIDNSVMGFWLQLVLLGIGWNFLFLAGTTLLPNTHLPEDKFKAQSLNDTISFSCQSIAALSAGWVVNITSWSTVMVLCLIPMALLVIIMIRDNNARPPK